MENLTLDAARQGAQAQPQAQPPPAPNMMLPPQPPPQLPPQMFTTAAQLLDLTDKKLLLSLRDGRKLTGILRSWDQFANLVLQSTTERIYAHTDHLYADIYRGTYLVRGENVLLLGEIDLDEEDREVEGWRRGEEAEVHALARREEGVRKRGEGRRLRALRGEGFEGENVGEVLLG